MLEDDTQEKNADNSWQGVLAFGSNISATAPEKKQSQQVPRSTFVVIP